MPEAIRAGGTYLSIGGAGIFDGIFLIGILAAFLSPGARKPQQEAPSRANEVPQSELAAP